MGNYTGGETFGRSPGYGTQWFPSAAGDLSFETFAIPD